jgi:hypothetical protein
VADTSFARVRSPAFVPNKFIQGMSGLALTSYTKDCVAEVMGSGADQALGPQPDISCSDGACGSTLELLRTMNQIPRLRETANSYAHLCPSCFTPPIHLPWSLQPRLPLHPPPPPGTPSPLLSYPRSLSPSLYTLILFQCHPPPTPPPQPLPFTCPPSLHALVL